MDKNSFIIYKSFYKPVKRLTNEQLGRLFRALFEYQIDKKEDVDDDIVIAFEFFKNRFDLDDAKYEKVVERNKKNIQKRWNNKDTKNTSGINGIPEVLVATKNTDNDNDNDNDNKKKNIKKKKNKYGIYGRVKLTSDEYEKLIKDYDEKLITNQINLLDEYIESNNNKNRYTNFNLVLRKSIRENWFDRIKKKESSKEPDWFDKNNENEELTDTEKQEMSDLLSDF